MIFSARLSVLAEVAPLLCVGLDPHAAILEGWGLDDSPAGLGVWAGEIEALVVEEGVALVKPQVAFFERHGVKGMTILHALLGGLRERGVVVIGDAKRGDIGSTMEGYAAAWLRPGADFEVDALTLVPYQGIGALTPALHLAQMHGKGVFVLSATSNPEAWATQSARRSDGFSVAGGVISDLANWVEGEAADAGSFGLVIGATVDQETLGVALEEHPDMPVLAPGYGAQGASLSAAGKSFANTTTVIPVVARSVLAQGGAGFGPGYRAALAELGAP